MADISYTNVPSWGNNVQLFSCSVGIPLILPNGREDICHRYMTDISCTNVPSWAMIIAVIIIIIITIIVAFVHTASKNSTIQTSFNYLKQKKTNKKHNFQINNHQKTIEHKKKKMKATTACHKQHTSKKTK